MYLYMYIIFTIPILHVGEMFFKDSEQIAIIWAEDLFENQLILILCSILHRIVDISHVVGIWWDAKKSQDVSCEHPPNEKWSGSVYRPWPAMKGPSLLQFILFYWLRWEILLRVAWIRGQNSDHWASNTAQIHSIVWLWPVNRFRLVTLFGRRHGLLFR